jgi:hypothetical protein
LITNREEDILQVGGERPPGTRSPRRFFDSRARSSRQPNRRPDRDDDANRRALASKQSDEQRQDSSLPYGPQAFPSPAQDACGPCDSSGRTRPSGVSDGAYRGRSHDSSIMRNDEKAIENAEAEPRCREEVHRGNRFAMVVRKGLPSPCRLGTPGSLPHPAQHGSPRNIETEHLQLAVNARRAQRRALGDDKEYEFAQFPTDALSSHTVSIPRKPRPVELESGPMPADDCFRLDENQCTLPSWPEPADRRHGVLAAATGPSTVECAPDRQRSGEAEAGAAGGSGDDPHPASEPRTEAVAGKKCGAWRN